MKLAAARGLTTLLLDCCSSLGLTALCFWACARQLAVDCSNKQAVSLYEWAAAPGLMAHC